ncbi:hypothetical protein [Streptomyces sp. YS-3]|uniref:hypothetical protein n=1 Tax=Streptomyces sp. YS-3 TaxID=3381352 RepID=UPI003862C10A
MASELSPDQVMRVLAALEAAWGEDEAALTALVNGGRDEQPLGVLVARYGATQLQNLLLIVTGIADLEGIERQEALTQFREGLVAHMATMATELITGWAASTGDDARATGALARSVLQTLLSFTTNGNNPQEVRALFAHLRANAMARS